MSRRIVFFLGVIVIALTGSVPSGPVALPDLGGGGEQVSITEDTFFQLIIPALEVDVPVFEAWYRRRTWDFRAFTEEAGHLQYTAYPGEGGNVVIGGHYELVDFSPGPFYELDALDVGDHVWVYYLGRLYTYEVTGTDLVDPSAVAVIAPTPYETLTLLTCYDYSPDAAAYTTRYVVRAVRIPTLPQQGF